MSNRSRPREIVDTFAATKAALNQFTKIVFVYALSLSLLSDTWFVESVVILIVWDP